MKLSAALLSVSFISGAATANNDAVSVQVGGMEKPEACSISYIRSPTEESWIAMVRSGPGTNYAKTGNVGGHQAVYVCDVSPDGRWIGIVYERRDNLASCKLSKKVKKRKPYTGRCNSGWVGSQMVVATYRRP